MCPACHTHLAKKNLLPSSLLPVWQGNEAFRDSDYPTAYDLYSKALQALWPHPPLHPRLALLLSNRAAALLSQGKPLR